MKFEISEDEQHRAKIPHEILLTNLIGNHILWFVAALGLVRSYWQPLALVPIFSVASLAYILWRARRVRGGEGWFAMCHWQLCARYSQIFIVMLLVLAGVSLLGWLGYTYLGMMEVAVWAVIGGVGVLPTMVTVLVLIILSSDALYQAAHGRLPNWIVARYPKPDGLVEVEEGVTPEAG